MLEEGALKKILFVLIICVLSTRVCASGGDILARVGDNIITRGDFDSLVSYYSGERRTDLSKDEKFKKELLNIMVRRMAFAYVAHKKGIDKKPEVVNLIRLYKNGILMSELIKEEVTDKIKIDDSDLELYYKMHPDEFKHADLVKVKDILLSTKPDMSDAERSKTKAKAEYVLKKIQDGEKFEKLASKYSDDVRSKANGGDLGYIQRGRLPKDLDDAAFSMKPGEVSGVVKTTAGYIIIKAEEKIAAGVWPLDKVKSEVREKVLRQIKDGRTKEFTEKVMKEAGVVVHPESLSSKEAGK
jgi:peptidyl-prolyl cis-trans isomerase C